MSGRAHLLHKGECSTFLGDGNALFEAIEKWFRERRPAMYTEQSRAPAKLSELSFDNPGI